MPHARDWDENETFPVETLRQAAALGFGGIYVEGRRRRLGADAARRHDHLRGTGAGLHLDRGLYLDPQHGGVDDRRLRRRGAAQEIPAEALHHGAFRELLPDRAGLRLRCREPEDHARGATATTTCSTAPRPSSPAAACPTSMSAWCAPAEPGPKGISCIVVEKGTPGLSFGAQEKKLGWKSQPTAMVMFENCRVPADKSDRQRRATASRSRWPGSTAAGSTSRPARSAARNSASTAPSSTCASASSSARGLSDFQALRFRIADYATELEAARLMVRRAAVAVGAGEPGGDAARRDGQAACHRRRLRGRSTAACNCTAATAICATIRSSACCATCACTRFSKAPTR